MIKHYAVLLFIFLLLSCNTGMNIAQGNADSGFRLNRYDLENDMYLPSEGIPDGIPDSWGWGKMPRVNLGINIPADWNAITGWGQVFADKSLPNPNIDFPLVRVHIKDLQLYILYNDNTWKLIQNVMDVDGHLYVTDSSNNIYKDADIRNEPEGGISIQAGSGYNFHFYSGRNTIKNKDNIKGVFAVCKARLLGTENYNKPPKYLISIGADYWRSYQADWAPNQANNDDIGIGRFKYITPEWQYFIMHTFKKSEVKKIKFPLE